MKEFFIDQNKQKRRLRFSYGDIILCDLEGKLIPYLVTRDVYDKNLYGLQCMFCTADVAVKFTKKQLQELLLTYKPYRVIHKHEMKDIFRSLCPEKELAYCSGR